MNKCGVNIYSVLVVFLCKIVSSVHGYEQDKLVILYETITKQYFDVLHVWKSWWDSSVLEKICVVNRH